ncbi:hypothetical protein GGX14DRAFT_479576 [Mycena pura]|uniref:Uncharacterized protein n=1 Tax=Mycena pura TaxID=153505 RepID=A0AAD6Y5V9_9AGAR|nr:hypothetical protein GGX14DRAFT_479576 [Mycena pura]
MALDTFGDFALETCEKLRVTVGWIIVVQEVSIGCTLFLRVYALYRLDKRIMILLLCTGVAIVTVGAWSVVPVELSPIMRTSAPGCYFPQSKAQALRMAAAWTAELAGDILVVCLTLYQSYAQRNGPLSAVSLWRVIIREGIVYFGIICLVNLANILVFHVRLGDVYFPLLILIPVDSFQP